MAQRFPPSPASIRRRRARGAASSWRRMGSSTLRPERTEHSALGTVFKMSQDGRVTKLHDFTGGSDGDWPYAAPIQSVEGDFYGTTGGKRSRGSSTVWVRLQDHEVRQLHAASRFYLQRWLEPSGAAGSRRRLLLLRNYRHRWPVRCPMSAPSSGSVQPVISRSS